MSEKETKNSIDDLLTKKKTSVPKKEKSMRERMYDIIKAQKIIDKNTNAAPEPTKKPEAVDFLEKNNTSQENDNEVTKLQQEKRTIQNKLNILSERLKAIYAIEYDDCKLIDDKTACINDKFVDLLTTIKEEKDKEVKLNQELLALQSKINVAKKEGEENTVSPDKKLVELIETEKKSNKETTSKIKALEKKIKETAKNLNDVKKEKTLALRKLTRLQQKYEVDTNVLKEQNKIKVKEAKQTSREAQKAKDTEKYNKQLVAYKKAQDAEKAKLRQAIRDLNRQLSGTKAKINNLNKSSSDVTKQNQKIASLNKKLLASEEKMKALLSLKTNNSELEKKYTDLDKEYKASLDSIKDLREQIDALNKAKQEYDLSKTANSDDNTKTKALADMNEKYEYLKINYAKLKDELQSSNNNVSIQKNENFASEKLDLLKKISELEYAMKDYDNLKADYDIAMLALKGAKDYADTLQDNYEDTIAQKKDLNSQIAALQSSLANYDHIKQQRNACSQRVESLETKIKDIVISKDTNSSLELSRDELQNIIVSKDQIILKKDQELEILKQELAMKNANQDEKLAQSSLDLIFNRAEDLSVLKLENARLIARITNLEEKIITMNSNIDANVVYKDILADEREEHQNAETHLIKALDDIKVDMSNTTDKLSRYSCNFLLQKMHNQINTIDLIIEDAKGGHNINKNTYIAHYEDLLKTYHKQAKDYENVLLERDKVLSDIKTSYQKKIDLLKSEGAPTDNYYHDIEQINMALKAKPIIVEPSDTTEIESEILRDFKNQIIDCHKQMELNIMSFEKQFDNKYSECLTIEELSNDYHEDCASMATKYASSIEKLAKENDFDNNPFSVLVRDEKMLMLIKEFQTLVKLKDKKYSEVFPALSGDNKIPSPEKKNEIDKINSNKVMLNRRIIQLQDRKAKEMESLNVLKVQLIDDIKAINMQIKRLEEMDSPTVFANDLDKLHNILMNKEAKIDEINNIELKNINSKYEKEEALLRDQYNAMDKEEEKIAEVSIQRQERLNQMQSMVFENMSAKRKIRIYEDINCHMLAYSDIEQAFKDIVAKRSDAKKNQDKVKVQSKLSKLWNLYDKYMAAKVQMAEDFEAVRTYDKLILESRGDMKKAQVYHQMNESIDAKVGAGIDVKKNVAAIKANNSKATNFESRSQYLKSKAKELLNDKNVAEYHKLVTKLDIIVGMIKENSR